VHIVPQELPQFPPTEPGLRSGDVESPTIRRHRFTQSSELLTRERAALAGL
jgi:hypothetical protein